MRNFILMEETLSTGSLVKRIATRRAHFVTLVNLLEERVGCLALQTVLPPHSKLPTLQVQLNITKRGPKRETPVTAARQHVAQHLDELYRGWSRAFTDGSMNLRQRAATAAAISEENGRIKKLSFHASYATAELAAVRLGLAMTNGKTDSYLVLLKDSRTALGLLIKFDRAPTLEREIVAKAYELQQEGGIIAFHWLSSHCGIKCNEAADTLYRRAHDELKCPTFEVPAFTDACLLVRRVISARHQELENGPFFHPRSSDI